MSQTKIRALAGACVAVLAASVARAQAPSLDEVLARAAGYVEGFHHELSGIVAEETYRQWIVNASSNSIFSARPQVPERRLRSDLLLLRPAGADRYVEFRDVFEVDRRPVRDREERLTQLFLEGSPSAATQIRRIIEESARYNIGAVVRTINVPTLALTFLEAGNQARFRFLRAESSAPSIGGRAGRDDDTPVFRVSTEMWVIEYEEVREDTIIRTPDGTDLPARGRFWIDPERGAVLMSELIVTNPDVRATIDVSYQSEPLLGFLVPVEMHERYQATRDVIEGRAAYGRFRRFQVDVDEGIRSPNR